MKFEYTTWTIGQLIDLITTNKINLKPSYQRNFIWGKKDQTSLIESINNGYPLPTFFIYQKEKGFEMVDGQQRSITIFQFFNKEIQDKNRNFYSQSLSPSFVDYPLNITLIKHLSEHDSLENFYTLVNKAGYHLTPNELNKAQFHDTNFLELVEKIVDSQELRELDIFSIKSKRRMGDRALIEEVVATIHAGVFDKRKAVDNIFKQDFSKETCEELYTLIIRIFNKLIELNNIRPIKETRYHQRNDFLTLIHFIFQNIDTSFETLAYQYNILLLIEDHIKPSQENCKYFKEYALNCVSQTNSRIARTARLDFFNTLLANTNEQGNTELNSILEYLEDFYGIDEATSLVKIGKYYLIDYKAFTK